METTTNTTAIGVCTQHLARLERDLRDVLDAYPTQADAILTAIQNGRCDGRRYRGDCPCFWAIIGMAIGRDPCLLSREWDAAHNSAPIIEGWFVNHIHAGKTPDNDEHVRITVQWILDWQAHHRATSLLKSGADVREDRVLEVKSRIRDDGYLNNFNESVAFEKAVESL